MNKVSPGRSLPAYLKQLPSPMLASVYPVVMCFTEIAIAEVYGLLTPNTIHIACSETNDQVITRMGDIAQELNTQYHDLIPVQWRHPVVNWGARIESSGWSSHERARFLGWVRGILFFLTPLVNSRFVDTLFLGSVHEYFLDEMMMRGAYASGEDDDARNDVNKEGRISRLRKCQGSYYTPPEVVGYIIEQTVKPIIDRDTSPIRLLDPACGGGAFLLEAYRYLVSAHSRLQGRSLSFHERISVLHDSVFGIDCDQRAVIVTRTALYLECLRHPERNTHQYQNRSERSKISQPDCHRIVNILDSTIRHGNFLIHYKALGNEALRDEEFSDESKSISWSQDYSQIMASGGFDVVIGNPPYLDSEQMSVWMPDLRRYCSQHYNCAKGNWDIFCVFIELALTLCRPGGYHSFIVPNKLASAPYAAATRSFMTTHGVLHSIRDYSQSSVFSASVYPLVYVVEKQVIPSDLKVEACLETKHGEYQIRYECIGSELNSIVELKWIDPSQLNAYRTDPNSKPSSNLGWILRTNADVHTIMKRIFQRCPTLGEIAAVNGAATVSEAYELKKLMHSDELNHPYMKYGAENRRCRKPSQKSTDLSHHKYDGVASHCFQVINSGTIDRYLSLWSIKKLRYLGTSYIRPSIYQSELKEKFPRRFNQANTPKIIVAGLTKHLECIADKRGTILAGKSTSIVQTNTIPLLYLLGILNSRLMHHIVLHLYGSNSLQGGYLRIGPQQLRTLPIQLPSMKVDERLIDDVESMIRLRQQQLTYTCLEETSAVDEKVIEADRAIDQTIFQIYGLTNNEINILNQEYPN